MNARPQSVAGTMLAAPGAVLIAALIVIPAIVVVGVAFTNWEFGRGRPDFIGIANFLELADDPRFVAALINTVAYVAMVVPITIGLGLFLALLIEGSGPMKKFYRAAHFLPVVATMAAMAVAWQMVLHPTFGLLNKALGLFGLPGANWLRDEHLVLPTLAFIGIWQQVGFAIIMFLAGLKSIPQELTDAAALDGATAPLDRIRTVTLPLLGPITLFVTIITAKKALAVLDTVWVMTQGQPDNASEVLVYLLYTESFEHLRAGYGAAISVTYLALLAVITLINRQIDRRVHYT